MTRKTNRDEENDMMCFFREQVITQSEQLASQVRQLDNAQILDRRFQSALNEALHSLAEAQGIHERYGPDYPPF
jgi:hypothetical protein